MSRVTMTLDVPEHLMDDLADKVNLRPGEPHYWLRRKALDRVLEYCAETIQELATKRRSVVVSDL